MVGTYIFYWDDKRGVVIGCCVLTGSKAEPVGAAGAHRPAAGESDGGADGWRHPGVPEGGARSPPLRSTHS